MATLFDQQQVERHLEKYQAPAQTPEGQRRIAERLEATLRRSRFAGAIVDKVKLMGEYLRDSAEPVGPKLLIGAALLYLVIPTDVLPDFMPLLGFTDDAAAILMIWNRLRDVFTQYEERRRLRMPAVEE